MIKKILIVALIYCLYSGYISNNNVEYTNTISYNVQSDIFQQTKNVGNYISTKIFNDETKFYAKQALSNIFNLGVSIISNLTDNINNQEGIQSINILESH